MNNFDKEFCRIAKNYHKWVFIEFIRPGGKTTDNPPTGAVETCTECGEVIIRKIHSEL